MSDSQPALANRAVFLSYASQDAEAVERIAVALRAGGVEVWYDKNDLVGGDAWDTKIKRQIQSCALFVPVVSANTQQREEGYFRREWHLAANRTLDMAQDKAFLLPVVTDATSDYAAKVPEKFREVQWTRLSGGEATPAFVARVQKLLGATNPALPATHLSVPAPAAGAPAAKSGRPPWITIALGAAVLALVAYVVLQPAAREIPGAAPAKPVAEAKSVAPTPARAPLAATTLGEKSIAVLPFANLSSEKENEFFADGVQDDVITNLAKIRDLTVISRTSTLAYRDAASRNLKQIARELGVATVLEGSVRRVGTKVHMNAQLIDARTDAHLWAETFDGDASDIFALQASLAQKIAAALKATLTTSERSLIERKPTHNQAAYDLFLRARLLQQMTGEGQDRPAQDRVVAAFEQVTAMDPEFALAHTQTALVHLVLYWFGTLDPSPERAAMAKAEIDTAMRLAPDAPETHLALGAYQYRVLRDWNRALEEFRIAEAGLPNDPQLFFWIAVTYRRLGQWREAIGYFERSAAIGPHDLATIYNYAQTLRMSGRPVQALDALARGTFFFPSERQLRDEQARTQFVIDGNLEAFLQTEAALPPLARDPTGRVDAYYGALWRGDWAAADRALADPRLVAIPSSSNVIEEPPVLHRAGVAFLRGDEGAARTFSGQAVTAFRTGRWNERQGPWVRMGIARAEAFGGQRDEALHDANAAVAEVRTRDALDFVQLRLQLAQIQVVLNQREAAFATLREAISGYGDLTPNGCRLDPFWSRVKDDPRFEEILKSAKSL